VNGVVAVTDEVAPMLPVTPRAFRGFLLGRLMGAVRT